MFPPEIESDIEVQISEDSIYREPRLIVIESVEG